MPLPDFLVIGAMKAGTTSLCRDLAAHPNIFFPSVKEPHTLVLDEVLTESGRRKYADLFQYAKPDQKCGEGSTGYTKRPFHSGVPERAHALLGDGLKLIYIVREPVSRTLSHHYHMYRKGEAPRDAAQAVKSISQLIDISRYAMQLKPWIERFGLEHLHVVRFEDYVKHRESIMGEIYAFLDVSTRSDVSDVGTVYNVGEKHLLPPDSVRGVIQKITRSQWYKRNIHPQMPQWVRDGFKNIFYKEAKDRPETPPAVTIEYIIDQVIDDVRELGEILGADEPVWKREEMRYYGQ